MDYRWSMYGVKTDFLTEFTLFTSGEEWTIDGLWTDEKRNYLPDDLDNQKNSSNFAVRYLDSSAPASSLAHYHL